MSQSRRGQPPALQQVQQHGQASQDTSITSPRSSQHAPVTPSKLRTPHYPGSSPEDPKASRDENKAPTREPERKDSQMPTASPTRPYGHSREPSEATVRTRLLSNRASEQQIGYGTEPNPRSTRPLSLKSQASSTDATSPNGFGGIQTATTLADERDAVHDTLGDAVTDGLLGGRRHHKPTATHHLAKRHGVKHSRMMYVFVFPLSCVE